MKKLLLALMILAVLIPFGYARENVGSTPQSFNKPMVDDYKLIDVNQISAWVTNYGSIFRHPLTGNSGFEFPAGGGVFAIYASGIWIGARPEGGEARVAVAEYSYEFGPGKIIEGSPDDSDDPRYEVYKWVGSSTIPSVAIDDGAPDEILGDQFLWSVYNDADPSVHVNMGTAPLSVEIQQSVFGFARTGPLGQTVFVKWLIINKSGVELEDTYISVWSDPDLGDSGDDFVGCDTMLSLGYVYNSGDHDSEYGDHPPAAGYDFLQGPIVPSPGDTAFVSGDTILDYRNLPMVSFVYYNNSNENNGNPQTGPEVYNYMQGKWRDGTQITFGGTGIDPTAPPTNFMFTGEPEAGTGWLDSSPADRRFMMTTGPFTLEPFEDTNGNGKEDIGEPGVQEIVVGVMVAKGADNLKSVSLLKEYDELAQLAYDLNFNLAVPPPPPYVDVSIMDREIVLNWSTEPQDTLQVIDGVETRVASAKEIESYEAVDPTVLDPTLDNTFNFQGYLVYQYDYLARENARLIGNYDIDDGLIEVRDLVLDVGTGEFLTKLVWSGNDGGLQRYLTITNDAFSTSAVTRLINGKRYWFGVVAWGYNDDSSPKTIYSPLIPGINFLELTPESPAIGTNYDVSLEGTLLPTSKEGPNDGDAFGMVINPTQLTGHDFKVTFHEDTDGQVFWRLTDLTTTEVVLDSQYWQVTDSADVSYPIYGGIQWKVLGPASGVHGVWQTANGAGPIPGVETEDIDEDVMWIHWLDAPGYPTEQVTPDGGWFFVTHGGGTANDEASFAARVFLNWDLAAANIYEMRFTADAAANGIGRDYLYGHLMGNVPFELWNMGPDEDDTSDDYRMCPRILGGDYASVYGGPDSTRWDFGGDDPSSSLANDPSSDWVYWYAPADESPGTAGYDAWAAPGPGNPPGTSYGAVHLARTRLMNWNGYASHTDSTLLTNFPHADTSMWDASDTTFMESLGWFIGDAAVDNDLGVATYDGTTGYVYGLVLNMPEVGTTIRWITNKPNTTENSFTFLNTPTPATFNSQSLAKKNIELINVFPNPYYGTHSGERTVTGKWVEFTHLPPTCTIRIFNLAGVLVRTIKRDGITERTWEKWDLQNESELPVASGIYIYHIEIPGVGEKIGKMALFLPEERLDTL